MTNIRAFISGIVLPSILLPLILSVAVYLERPQLSEVLFVHYLPIIWGVWNIIYFAGLRESLPGSQDVKLMLTGLILGLLVAIVAVFFVDLPEAMGLEGNAVYIPLVLGPILYAILWWLVVNPLNKIVGVENR
ncbi:MAG: hypothetical protein WD595_07050 [Waddliaceae bacterium]